MRLVWAIQLGCLSSFGIAHPLPSPAPGSDDREPEIHFAWTPLAGANQDWELRVSGLPSTLLDAYRRLAPEAASWPDLLTVYTDMGSVTANVGLPPLLGRYGVHQETNLVFTPDYPPQPGMTYRAVLRVPNRSTDRPGKASVRVLSSVHRQPSPEPTPPTRVGQIHPSASVLPENLLKFYIEFTAPMSRGHVYDYIQLMDESGRPVDLPFLELDEELWDPSLTRLTLFIDPGRIKRGVKPLEDIGPALTEGSSYTLIIHPAWRDAQDRPLQREYRKTFAVTAADRDPPDPADWSFEVPRPDSHESLRVRFPEPLDHALAARLIRVLDAQEKDVPGLVSMEDQDRCWSFQPEGPWSAGIYQVSVLKIIEDLAGNNIGKPFEVESSRPVPKDLASGSVRLPFHIR